MPEQFFVDFQHAVESIAGQLDVTAFNVHTDITRPAAEWTEGTAGHAAHYEDGAFVGSTTGWHAEVPEWQMHKRRRMCI